MNSNNFIIQFVRFYICCWVNKERKKDRKNVLLQQDSAPSDTVKHHRVCDVASKQSRLELEPDRTGSVRRPAAASVAYCSDY